MIQSTSIRAAALAALLLLAPAAFAQQTQTPAQQQSATAVEPPPTPEAERASFTVADGFDVTLFASEPMVEKPIAINFDPAGRLWVATSNTYPQVKPGQTPDDKVIVLEDTDGDGKADKSTVFAEGLLIPTGVLPGDGGAYVANSTEIVHFIDRDGDLKADDYRVVLSGFGTEDTHHIIHTFRWGYDGRLYFNQSVYIHSNVETPFGRRTMNSSGTWRYRPENSKLDPFIQGMWNPWGHTLDRYGNSFETDGAGSGGVHYVFPGAVFVTAKDAFNKDIPRILGGLNEGSPKFCGAELVGGRHLPDDWQNCLITNDFRANRVVRFKIEETQAGYFASKPMPDVIKSSSRFFRPLDLKMGPDGAIYLADWCNQIINHGEVDFRDPRRDKGHGRIWRITAKGRPLVERPKLAAAGVGELFEQLKSPEPYARAQAKVVLRSKGKTDVLPALAAFLKSIDGSDAPSDALRLEALWVYQSLDVPEPTLLARLLKSSDFRVRAAAVRVIPDWQGKLTNPTALSMLQTAVADDAARVRLEAVSALASIDDAAAVEVAMRTMEKPLDPLIDFALWRTANLTKDTWLPAFQSGKLTFGGRANEMTRALQDVKAVEALATLVQQLKAGTLSADARGGVLDLIAQLGGGADLAVVYNIAIARETPDAQRVAALGALERAARQRSTYPSEVDRKRLTLLFVNPNADVALGAVRLAGAWIPDDSYEYLRPLASGQGEVGSAAVDAIAQRKNGAPEALRELADKGSLIAIADLARFDLKEAANRAAARLTSQRPADGIDRFLERFLQREGGAAALNDALQGKQINQGVAQQALAYLNVSGRDAGPLLQTIRKSAGVGAVPKSPSPEELQQIVAKVPKQGDAARGEQVFRRQQTGCYNCHMIAGAGANVGPDLRAIGASSPLDYIVESVLNPNKAIKDGYASLVVATKKGDVYSGIPVMRDDQQLVLRDATHDRIVIPVGDIRRQKDGGSLMPVGLADTLTEQEFLDLCRFLSELGKPGAFAADKQSVVRRWRVLDGASAGALTGPKADALPWRPAYSLAGGALPMDVGSGDTLVARAEIDVTSPGRLGYAVNDGAGIKAVYLDDQRLQGQELTGLSPEMNVGRHHITFVIDRKARGETGLELELKDAEGEAGHVQIVGGR